MTLEKAEAGFAITQVHLEVTVTSHGSDPAALEAAAGRAKANCPVSKVLNAKISMDANLKPELFLLPTARLAILLIFKNPCSFN